MKQAQRDSLLERQVQAAEIQAELSRQLIETLERPEKNRRRKELGMTYGSPPRRLLHGEQGLRTMARIPGFAGLFADKTVPDSHLLRVEGRDHGSYTIVQCVCGAQTPLEVSPVDECSGGCGRWFLLAREAVHVHKFNSGEPCESLTSGEVAALMHKARLRLASYKPLP